MRSTANRPTSIRILILAAAALAASASICQALEFPGPAPGAARAVVADGQCLLENDAIACVWTLRDGQFRPTRVTDKLAGTTIEFDPAFSQCFVLGLASDKRLAASEMKLVGEPRVERIEAEPGASCLARRSAGMKIVASFVSPDGNLEVRWEAVLRDGSSYVRPSVTLDAKREPVDVASLELIDLALKGDATGRVVGSVPGSLVVSGDFYFAYEHANATSTVKPAGQGRGRKSSADWRAMPRFGRASRPRRRRSSAWCPRASCGGDSSTTSNASGRIPIGPRCTTIPGTTSPGRATG